MAVRTALRFELPNRSAELVKALRPIAQAGVNLHALAGMTHAGTYVVELLPHDAPAAASALNKAGISAREVSVVVTWLPNRPGALLKACEALADAEIDIESAYVVSTDSARGVQMTFECGDAARADQVLGELSHSTAAR
jgi:hypothetical protein